MTVSTSSLKTNIQLNYLASKSLYEMYIRLDIVTAVVCCVGTLIERSIHKQSSELGFCMFSQAAKKGTLMGEIWQ